MDDFDDDDSGAVPPPPKNNDPPPPTESDVAPVQPTATPAPVAPAPPAEPQLAVVSPEGDSDLTVPAVLLAIALIGLALLAASVVAARNGHFAGWGHACREASYRATGAWGDFGDWLRLGR